MKVPFYKHNLNESDVAELLDTLSGVFLTSGPKTQSFEQKLATYLGVGGALGTTSWTTAAFLVLKAWGIGPGDEVVLPALTFIASSNVVLHCGAKPVFVDVESKTGNMDLSCVPSALGPSTRVILPVHLYGQMVDVARLAQLVRDKGIKILEDSAHCIEGTRKGAHPGQLSDAACFSFYATKNITSGEGGAVASNDLDLLEQIKLLRLHGMSLSASDRYTSLYKHWDMTVLGYKANMSDIQAALLLHQLERIDRLRERKEEICQYYEREFKAAGIGFPQVESDSISARHLFTIWAPPGQRDALLGALQKAEIGVAVNFRPVHLMSYYRERFGYCPGMFPRAERIGNQTLTLPMYPCLTDAQVEYVAKTTILEYRRLDKPCTPRCPEPTL
ncbi:MAG: DegT/DnrJ/EryC1/StrS family aminotransferase [Bdellovibrionales bacterium]|nr:DegT/DnrJ/EryC1/StrS family aminotransferase [Bdellovibrionales bacterium]